MFFIQAVQTRSGNMTRSTIDGKDKRLIRRAFKVFRVFRMWAAGSSTPNVKSSLSNLGQFKPGAAPGSLMNVAVCY